MAKTFLVRDLHSLPRTKVALPFGRAAKSDQLAAFSSREADEDVNV
jgi:hypothetical protein